MQEGSCADAGDLLATDDEILNQHLQTARIYVRLALEALQCCDLVIEFLVNLRADIAAREYRENFEQCGKGRAGGKIGLDLAVVEDLLVKKLESQESTHAFVERLLVERRACRCLRGNFSCGFRHRRILRQSTSRGK